MAIAKNTATILPSHPRAKNISGQRFVRLVAIRCIGVGNDGRIWLCQCDCGKCAEVSAHKLASGNTKSCGCLRSDTSRLNRFQDLAGRRFGRLVVLRICGDDGHHHSVWTCQCDCGRQPNISSNQLTRGRTKSCGCLHDDTVALRNAAHGLGRTSEYKAFHSAKRRCTSPKDKHFKNYGGRGILFLFDSFEQFYAELGMKPTPKHTVDRIDNDGNYEPGNVRWATRKQQIANQRPRRKAS